MWDNETFKSHDLVGECVIDLFNVKNNEGKKEWFPLTYKGNPAGEIYANFYLKGVH